MFDLRDSGDRNAHTDSHLFLSYPAPLAYLGEPPAASITQHRGDGCIEGLLAADGRGALQMARIPPPRHAANWPFPSSSQAASEPGRRTNAAV